MKKKKIKNKRYMVKIKNDSYKSVIKGHKAKFCIQRKEQNKEEEIKCIYLYIKKKRNAGP